MAASNSPCLSSPSESDSDREPNSRGARVFWGQLKTPEKSRSTFVDPPQTVVRTQGSLHTEIVLKSTGISMSLQDKKSSPEIFPIVGECDDGALNPAHLNNTSNTIPGMIPSQMQRNDAHPHTQRPSSDSDTGKQVYDLSSISKIQSISPQPAAMKTPLLESSESEAEREPVLLSPPTDTIPPLNHSNDPLDVAHQSPLSSIHVVIPFAPPPLTAERRAPRASELPDLISFDMPTPPRLPIPELPHSSLTPPNQLPSSSSSVTVDDLLAHSPVRSKSPSQPNSPHVLSESHPDGLDQEAFTTASPAIEPEVAHQVCVSSNVGYSFQITPDAITDPLLKPSTSHLPSTTDSSISSSQRDTTESNNSNDISTCHLHTTEDGPTTLGFNVSCKAVTHTPRSTLNYPPSTSGGQTRKRSPSKGSKGKEKPYDGDHSSSESSNNTSRESPGPSGNGDENANDKAARKERRAKAKREAERTRQQLLSLSPTSANVLNLLASPDRDSPIKHFPLIGLDEAVSDIAGKSDLPKGSTQAEPATPQMTGARRILISSSPQCPARSPLRFIAPSLVNLDDPDRTPARRIPVPSNSQGPHSLPLDDPNRTPARRVIIEPSPSRPAESTGPSAPRIRIEENTPLKQAMLSLVKKSTTQPASSKLRDNTTSSSSVSRPQTVGESRSLPFPIRRTVARGSIVSTSARNVWPTANSGTAKQSSVSNLRQSLSISTSKIARITTKPYSRPPQGPTRLPVISSSRGATTSASVSSASTTNGTGPSKPAPAAVLTPSRIPSPSKRYISAAKLPQNEPAVPSASTSASVNNTEDTARATTIYKRKRQRMISEDDIDEPPAKRAVIMVRPVIKGMYNKTIANPDGTESRITQREASPVRSHRPPGPIQVRPVIPGTLRHFETTRSSSRDNVSDPEQDDISDTQATVPGSSDAVILLPSESREMTPTDTASTVTTLSREPTLEELPSSSGPRSDTPVPTESGPELRRTSRVRKPYGPDALATPNLSTTSNRRTPISLTRTTSIMPPGGSLLSRGSSRSTTHTGMVTDGFPLNPRQLQALTDANTLRNQTCVADLQRKVVRRPGPRPASPTSKVRTIMDKSREERSKEREARAERRRRRDLGSNVSASSEGDYMDTDVPSSPAPDMQATETSPPTKHVRGPGDEEDYETPERQPKASRIDPSKLAKTVKWDRGLAKTISEWAANEAASEGHEKESAEPVGKGCLIRDRTTLDSLGNVPDANIPLEDLGRERVIVARFVYDDDIEVTRPVKKKKT